MSNANYINEFLPPFLVKKIKRFSNTHSKPKPDFLTYSTSNARFYNCHEGERVFILASGPSIQTQNLKPLRNEICIAVSHFHLHGDIQEINPEYHILAPQHAPFTDKDISKLFQDFQSVYPPNKTSIFLGLSNYRYNYLKFLQMHPEYSDRNYYFIDYSKTIDLTEKNVESPESWDICGHPFSMRTVIYGAIQLAVYMNFKEIVLLGCDHDYLQDVTRVTNHHFYPEENGISDREHLSQFSSEQWFYEYYMRWKQYRLMKEYLAERGAKIINCTNGGMLDVFERMPLEMLLKGSSN